MNTPHKHAAIIKAWADGKNIQVKSKDSTEWFEIGCHPAFYETNEYRIKESNVIQYFPVNRSGEMGKPTEQLQDAINQASRNYVFVVELNPNDMVIVSAELKQYKEGKADNE